MTVSVPLATLMKLPPRNSVCGCIETENIFSGKAEQALIVIFTDGGGVRKSLFSVADGTYLGEY